MAEAPKHLRCDQAVRPDSVNACCVNEFDPCFKPATHQHTQTGIALCATHWRNASTLGGRELGEWQVGMRILPFPDGWAELPDPEPERADATPATLWVAPAKTAGGLIIEV